MLVVTHSESDDFAFMVLLLSSRYLRENGAPRLPRWEAAVKVRAKASERQGC